MTAAKHFGLVAAAGAGMRFGDSIPKQYAILNGEPVLSHALRILVEGTALAKTFVVLAPTDRWFSEKIKPHPRIAPLYCGGDSRNESVLRGLELIRGEAHERDWILVHDAARPCLPKDALMRLLTEVADDRVGGLLAVPVADTLKRADVKKRVMMTSTREDTWQAQTPQMFRYGLLLDALRATRGATDEAQAVEHLGHHPKLVLGSTLNIKITSAEDLRLAQAILNTQEPK